MASNFPRNKNIKVSEKTVSMLRKGTMAGNLAKAKGASPELREALVRFYGAKRVNAAAGTVKPKATPAAAKREQKASNPIHKSFVQTPKKNQSGNGSGRPMAVQPKKTGGSKTPTPSRVRTIGNVAEVGKPTGSLGNQLSAGKNYKAPKNYKPLSTATKVGMAASVTPVGKGAMLAAKGVGSLARGGKAMQILANQKAVAATAKAGAKAAEKAAAKKAADAAAKKAAKNTTSKVTAPKTSTAPAKSKVKPSTNVTPKMKKVIK